MSKYCVYIEGLNDDFKITATSFKQAIAIAMSEGKRLAEQNQSYKTAYYAIGDENEYLLRSGYVRQNHETGKFSYERIK